MPDPTPIPIALKHRLKTRIQVAGQLNNRWQAYLTEGQTIEDALEPSFWVDASEVIAGHTGKLGMQDIIEVRKADTGQYWELMIDEVGKGYLRVRVLLRDTPPIVEIPETAPLATRWNVGARGHEVIRKMDKQVMAGPFPTKAKAAEWIADHLKAMAA